MSEPAQFDICIVGGGMVGLTLAELIAAEFPQTKLCLVEKKAYETQAGALWQPGFDSRSTALSMGSVEIFKALKIWADVCKHATPIHSVHVSDRGHFGTTGFSREENGGEELGYVVENAWLGCCLINNLNQYSNIQVSSPAAVGAVQAKRDGALLRINSSGKNTELELKADLVIIADGADSGLRKLLAIDVEVKDYQQHAVIANIEFQQAHNCCAYERFTKNGPLALLPLGYGPEARTSALVFTRPLARVQETLALNDDAFMQEVQKAFGQRLGKFIRVGKRVSYPLSLTLAKEQVRSSFALVGNAAHFLHPVAGQGFNLALRDVTQLLAVLKPVYDKRSAGKNVERYGDIKRLNKYLEVQNRDQLATSFVSDSFNQIFSNEEPVMQLGRNLGLLGLELFDGLKRGVFSRMMGQSMARAKLNVLSYE